jgi:hypothetical protein
MAGWFSAQLSDLSPNGFRARHHCLHLPSGQLVGFQMVDRGGMARAVWTRVVNGIAETGFRIVEADKA